jgi:ferritin-like metal-binding protein YciE
MDKINSLRDLFVDQLNDLYSAEQQLTKALPKFAKAASSDTLRDAFEEHMDQTRQQLRRLDAIFDGLGMDRSGRGGTSCEGMKGILQEGETVLSKARDPNVRDAAIIASAQRVEHYEIAGYGTARAYARVLGENDAERLLSQTLDEEAQTDKRLTTLAEGRINVDAREEQR